MKHFVAGVLAGLVLLAACGGSDDPLTLYSGRSEDLIGPLVEQFEEQFDRPVEVRYAGSTELSATLLAEGDGTPADLFIAQDPASLGAIAGAGLFAPLETSTLDAVDPRFRDPEGRWVGVSGRARVLVYNTTSVDAAELPASVWDLTDPAWSERLGIAPTNGSFLSFVAAMILTEGEDRTLEWLEAIAANAPVAFSGNSPTVAATDAGEIDAGLVNHYYLFRLEAEQGRVDAANHFLTTGDAASLVMPAGAGILAASDNQDAAEEFVRFLLGDTAQRYFADETFEYPLAGGIAANPALPPLESLVTPPLDLSELASVLDRATELVTEAGLV